MHLRIGPFEITLRDQSRPAVAGTRNINNAGIFFLDEAIQMHVNKILARRCAPMSQEPRLDMLGLERLLQERVILQIDLPDRQIIRGLPVTLHNREGFRRKRSTAGLRRRGWPVVGLNRGGKLGIEFKHGHFLCKG